MKFYDLIVRHIRVRNAKELIILLLKLALILFIADEVYAAVRYFICSLQKERLGFELAIYCVKQFVLIYFIYILYRCAKHFQNKGTLKKAIKIFIIISIITSFINGSILGLFFWDGPYWGRVVDADIGEPVAGAYVMGRWEFECFLFTIYDYTFADARETVTDKRGLFFLPIARTAWYWPLSRIELEELYVYKPGYDSHPPHMQYAWNDKDKEKWLHKLNKQYPEARQKYIKVYHPIDHKEYFSNPRYAPSIYTGIFRVNCKFYKPSIIKLNKTLSVEEQRRAAGAISLSGARCEGYKISKIKKVLNR